MNYSNDLQVPIISKYWKIFTSISTKLIDFINLSSSLTTLRISQDNKPFVGLKFALLV